MTTSLPTADRPLSVSELTNELKSLIQEHFAQVYVEGEISGCRPAASGHVYFTLKDSKAAISCVLWASQAARLQKPLRDGDKVEIRGAIDVFAPRGTYQIIVQSVRPAGIGDLFLAFQALKERLEKEGLFDEARKRPLPTHPRVVGVVTSPTGAVIRDILKVLGRRAPHVAVLLFPVKVQGDGAAQEITYAIRRFNTFTDESKTAEYAEGGKGEKCLSLRPDVLIVGRGGGSLEDLWAFNEEIVARAIADSDIPVVSAVGHQTDFTIADFVADKRAPTPSAAAEMVSRDSAELIRDLSQTKSRLQTAMQVKIAFLRQTPHLHKRLKKAFLPRVDKLREKLNAFRRSAAYQRPLYRVNEERQRLDDVHQRIDRALKERLREAMSRHERLAAQLAALNPRAVLKRGYSITLNARTGQAVRRAADAGPATPLRIILHEGQLDAVTGGHAAAGASQSVDSPPTPSASPARARREAGTPRRSRKSSTPRPVVTPDLFAEPDMAGAVH